MMSASPSQATAAPKTTVVSGLGCKAITAPSPSSRTAQRG